MGNELTAYEILGVSETASADEIEAAYRRRIREFHPDLNKGDNEWIGELDRHYAKVSSRTRRREYDEWLARQRADKAKEEAERAAADAPADEASEPPSAPPATPKPTPRAPSPPTRPRRARGSSNAGHRRSSLRDSTPWPAPEPYRYEAYNEPGKQYEAADVFDLLGAALMVFAWWFFFSGGFFGFSQWWNPVAWIPLVWMCAWALSLGNGPTPKPRAKTPRKASRLPLAALIAAGVIAIIIGVVAIIHHGHGQHKSWSPGPGIAKPLKE